MGKFRKAINFLKIIIIIFISCFIFDQFFQTKEALSSGKEKPKGGTLGTASIGGTFYVWGGAWSKIISNKVNFPVSVEVTGGPVHNVQLVSKGDLTFGLVSMPTAFDGWNGLRWAKGNKFQDIRVLLPMYASFNEFWALVEKGIKSVYDLNGRVVNLGPKGGTPDTYGRLILEILGIKPGKIINSGYNDLVSQMLDGIIDAGYTTGGVPHDAVMQTEASKPIVVFTEAEREFDAEKIMKELPCFFLGKIPAGSYKAVKKDIPTLRYWNILITHKDFPDDLAYKIVKVHFENLTEFTNVYRDTINTVPANITESVVPLHKGVLKFYNEKGVKIPLNLIPPEVK